MTLLYNVSPYSLVVDWSAPAVSPGGSYDFPAEIAAGLSASDWSPDQPASKNASNQSGGSFSKSNPPAPKASLVIDPATSESAATQEVS